MKPATWSRIEEAVAAVCTKVAGHEAQSDWRNMEEEELFYELCVCILGSQVPHESSLAAARYLRSRGCFHDPQPPYWGDAVRQRICGFLSEPLQHPARPERTFRYRFPRSRAGFLLDSARSIYSDSRTLRGILLGESGSRAARRTLCNLAVGLGPKQASLFLRNVGFANDLAILDTHVLNYLSRAGMESAEPSRVSRLGGYERIEEGLQRHAAGRGVAVGILDQAIWIVMRVAQREALL